MKDILNKIIPSLLLAMIAGMIGTLGQVRDNSSNITNIHKEIGEIKDKHAKRLSALELSKENMPDYYVTRREFNLVIQSLNEKMNKVDKNVEKLLDLQMKEK